jgi:hypothetical protein
VLRYIGVICIFIFAFCLIYYYDRYQKQREACEKTLLDFLIFLENEMRGLGRPVAVCAEEFSRGDALCAPFFSSLTEGRAPIEAYRSVRSALSLRPEMDGLLLDAFGRFSHGRDAVRRGLSEARERFSALLDAERAERARRFRLFRTLAAASAMGLVILLL